MNFKIDEVIAPLRGAFSLRVIDKYGNIIEEYMDNNLIVNAAKVTLASLISNASVSNKVITKIGFGTGNTTPTASDTALTNAYVKNISRYTYPSAGQVKFSWTLDYGEANPKAIAEFGLLSSDGTLFARKVRSVINKDSDLALAGDWTIIF